MIRIVLPGWDSTEIPVGLIAGLVVWTLLTWWASRAVASRAGTVEREGEPGGLLRWFWLGVTLKTAIIVVWYLAVGGHEITPSIGDSGGYDASGWEVAQGLRDGRYLVSLPRFLEKGYPGFYYWVGAIYALFGHHPILVSLFDNLLSIWMAVMIHQVAGTLFDARVARYALLGALFYPQWISASYFILKDLATTFVITLTIWAVYVPRRLEMRAVTFLGALLLLSTLRAPLAVMVGALGVVQFALSMTGPGRQRRVLIAAVVLIAFVVAGTGSRSGDSSIFETGITTQAGVADDRGFLAGTRLTFDWNGLTAVSGVVLGKPVTFARHAIATMVRFFYGPFFLFAQGGANLYPYGTLLSPFRAVLECLSGVFTGLLMPMILVGLYECVRFRRRATFLLTGWLAVGLVTLILAGLLVRWRLPFIVVAFIFAGVGCARFRHIRDFYCAYVVLYALFIGVNTTLQEDLILPKALLLAVALVGAARFLVPRAADFARARWAPRAR